MCPHTACGEFVRRTQFADFDNIMLVSTAHPAKFDTVVEPLIGTEVPLPPALADLLDKPNSWKDISTDYNELFL